MASGNWVPRTMAFASFFSPTAALNSGHHLGEPVVRGEGSNGAEQNRGDPHHVRLRLNPARASRPAPTSPNAAGSGTWEANAALVSEI